MPTEPIQNIYLFTTGQFVSKWAYVPCPDNIVYYLEDIIFHLVTTKDENPTRNDSFDISDTKIVVSKEDKPVFKITGATSPSDNVLRDGGSLYSIEYYLMPHYDKNYPNEKLKFLEGYEIRRTELDRGYANLFCDASYPLGGTYLTLGQAYYPRNINCRPAIRDHARAAGLIVDYGMIVTIDAYNDAAMGKTWTYVENLTLTSAAQYLLNNPLGEEDKEDPKNKKTKTEPIYANINPIDIGDGNFIQPFQGLFKVSAEIKYNGLVYCEVIFQDTAQGKRWLDGQTKAGFAWYNDRLHILKDYLILFDDYNRSIRYAQTVRSSNEMLKVQYQILDVLKKIYQDMPKSVEKAWSDEGLTASGLIPELDRIVRPAPEPEGDTVYISKDSRRKSRWHLVEDDGILAILKNVETDKRHSVDSDYFAKNYKKES